MARNIFLLAMILFYSVHHARACDACGCSAGGIGLGLMAVYRGHLASVHYQFAPFSSQLEQTQGAKDFFHTTDWLLRYRLGLRWNLQFNQGFRWNYREHPDGNYSLSGLGDTRLGANYILFSQKSLGAGLELYGEAGGGFKVPTGKFDPDLRSKNLPENFNPGQGAWGWQLQSNWVLKHPVLGLAVTTIFSDQLASKGGYHFGSQWMGQFLLFRHQLIKGDWSVMPYAGLQSEIINRDLDTEGFYAHGTGGKGLFLTTGANLKWSGWMLGGAISFPFHQHYSNAEVGADPRINIQFSRIF